MGTTKERIRDEMRRDFAEWMTTNEDLVRRPPIALMKEGNEFAARTLLWGVDERDVEVLVAPERLLIKGKRLMASVAFPKPVDPATVRAQIRDGMLSVRAAIAGAFRPIVLRPRAA